MMTRIHPRLFRLAAGTFALAILGANAHLAYVALASQPGCVAHARTDAQAGPDYTAATSSC